MAETAAEREYPKRKEDIGFPAVIKRTDMADSIISGNGDGFPLGSWRSQTTTQPAHLTDHVNSIHNHPNRECKGMSPWYNQLLADDGSLHTKTSPYPHQVLNPDTTSTKPQHPFSGMLDQKWCCTEDGVSTMPTPRIGTRCCRMDSQDGETDPEIIGEVVKQPAMVTCDGDEADTDCEDESYAEEKEENGVGLWNRSTVLVLMMFVGFRLMFEVWFGDMDAFLNKVDDNPL